MEGGRFWCASHALNRRMFVEDVLAGTLVFRRGGVGPVLRATECFVEEDARLLLRLRGGAACRLDGEGC